MNTNFDDKYPEISEQAANWLIELSDAAEPDEKLRLQQNKAFVEWLKLSPIHIREFLKLSAIWQELGMLTKVQFEQIEQSIKKQDSNILAFNQDTMAESSVGEQLPPNTNKKLIANWVKPLMGLAASVLLAVLIFLPEHNTTQQYQALVGDQKTVELADSSQVRLNTDTLIDVAFKRNQRHVYLRRGEALFSVTKDPDKPFIVDVEDTRVEVLGTRFNVKKGTYDNPGIQIYVVEGVVSVKALLTNEEVIIHKGQQALVPENGSNNLAINVQRLESDLVTAWTQGKIVFENQRLSEVVNEFNRYSHRDLILLSEELKNMTVSGVFNASDSDGLVAYLAQIRDVQVQLDARGNKTIRLLSDSVNTR